MSETAMPPAPIEAPPVAGPARPRFIADAGDEKLWNVVVALSTELAATRSRLDAVERLLAERGTLPAGTIDHWQPSLDAGIERAQELQDYTRRVFGAITRA